jgi:plastocyanin
MLRRHTAVLALMLAGLLLGASGCTIPTSDNGGGYGPTGKQAKAQPDLPAPVLLKSGVASVLQAKDYHWQPGNYVVAPDADVVLKVTNGDSMQHNFTVEGEGLSKNLPTGSQVLVKFPAPSPGKHRFYCKYHREEMQGWITVK